MFEDEDEEDEEAEPKVEGSQPAYVGRYLAWHARRQLSFGTRISHPSLQ